MNQSSQLIDYIASGVTVDLTQSVFPGREWEDLHKEIDVLSNAIIPDLHMVLKRHIDTLYIPDMTETVTQNMIPDGFYELIAIAIDEHCPDWNIVQKTVLYWHYLGELRNTGQRDFLQRMADKHRNKVTEESETTTTKGAMNVMMQDDKEPDDALMQEMINPSIKPPQADCN